MTTVTIPDDLRAEATLGDLATRYAAASRVFHAHKIDFCCGGQRTLSDACRDAHLDVAAILADIRTLTSPREDFTRWDTQPVDQLIRHILDRYHAEHRKDLVILCDFARRVDAAHRATHPEVTDIRRHLEYVAEELEMHMQKEEMILFPMLEAAAQRQAYVPIQMMRREHDDHGKNIQKMRRLTHDYVAPADACTTWKAFYLGLDRLERDLMNHIHLENNVLFARFTADM